jgi:hypothetical protein
MLMASVPETPSQEEGASVDALDRIRRSLLIALQETERIEECLQGISNAPVAEKLQSLVKHLTLIDESANHLDPDHSTVPSHILLSLASQSSESVEIIANVKAQIDDVAARGHAQILPIAALRAKIQEFTTDADISTKFKDSVSRRGLLAPPFLK